MQIGPPTLDDGRDFAEEERRFEADTQSKSMFERFAAKWAMRYLGVGRGG